MRVTSLKVCLSRSFSLLEIRVPFCSCSGSPRLGRASSPASRVAPHFTPVLSPAAVCRDPWSFYHHWLAGFLQQPLLTKPRVCLPVPTHLLHFHPSLVVVGVELVVGGVMCSVSEAGAPLG